MATFHNPVTIARPADEVFAFLADFSNIPAWNYAIASTGWRAAVRLVAQGHRRGPPGILCVRQLARAVPGGQASGSTVPGDRPASGRLLFRLSRLFRDGRLHGVLVTRLLVGAGQVTPQERYADSPLCG